MMNKDSIEMLEDMVLSRINMRSYYAANGVKFGPVGRPTKDGSFRGISPFNPDSAFRVHGRTGDWEDAESGDHGGLYAFTRRVRGLPDTPEGNLEALRHLCVHCGLAALFDIEMQRSGTEGTTIPDASTHVGEPHELSDFSETDKAENTDKYVRVNISITGDSNIVYDSPSTFRVVYCPDMNTQPPQCRSCEGRTFEIGAGHPEHISSYGSNDEYRHRMCRNVCCPMKKKGVQVEILGKHVFREVAASPYVVNESVIRTGTTTMDRRIYMKIDKDVAVDPRGYSVTGWIRTNPRTGVRTLLVDTWSKIREQHETFSYKDRQADLNSIRNLGWQALVKDLAATWTGIRGQQDLHLVYLLTYCSPRWLRFNGETIRGWLTSCVLGDSGVGKSKIFDSIASRTGLGDIFQALTSSRTGLTYGIEYAGTHWRCRAGMHPRCTGKLLCVEDAHELDQRDVGTMAAAMDEGILRVQKIVHGDYETETRLIFNCNPKGGGTLSSYVHGCLALRDIFTHMFIRRLDLALVMRRSEVAPYNIKNDGVESKVTREALSALICYAWTITPGRVIFSDAATTTILQKAEEMSQVFGWADEVPLVFPGDFRKTLARMSAAWAIMELATPDHYDTIAVGVENVNNAANMLSRIYTATDCGLDKYASICRKMQGLEDYHEIEAEVMRRIGSRWRDVAEGRNPFARLLWMLNNGVYARKTDVRRQMDDAGPGSLSDVLSFLESTCLARSESDGTLRATSKFGLFMRKFESDHPEEMGMIRGAVKNAAAAGQDEKKGR